MGINIKKPAAEAAIRDFAASTGLGLTEAIEHAIAVAKREREAAKVRSLEETNRKIDAILARAATRPILDDRSAKEIMDDLYDEDGLPK